MNKIRKILSDIVRPGNRNLAGKILNNMGNLLPKTVKTGLVNFFVNTFRIPRVLVPVEGLEAKYRDVLNMLIKISGSRSLGDYLEFGVYQGTSMLCMHKALEAVGLKNVRLFGFDSFQGLPPAVDGDDAGRWTRGQYSSRIDITRQRLNEGGVDWDNTFLVKGYFNDTLNTELLEKYNIKRAGIIMIDCDMYSSAKTALSFCAQLIGGEAVIFFDDWGSTDEDHGEKRAFAEFLKENPDIRSEDIGTYGRSSKVFRVYRTMKGGPRNTISQ
jgi:predicted O-methyltransferase YrrM